MWVVELAMVVYLASKVAIILLRALKNNLDPRISLIPPISDITNLGSIGKFVGSQINLSKTAFANHASQGVISNMSQVLRAEFTIVPRISLMPSSNPIVLCFRSACATHSSNSW